MSALRIVLDSNVIISGFLFGGPPARLLGHALDGSIQCFTSLDILDEVRDVLRRPKFGLSADQALTLVEELHDLCEVVTPTQRVRVITADPDDNRILECALSAGAGFVASGDSHLLDLAHWKGIRILAPADVLAVAVCDADPERLQQTAQRFGIERQFKALNEIIDSDEKHLSFEQGGGHHSSHPHLVHEFVRSIVEQRQPWIDPITAANWTAAGICAHESAMQGGKCINIPAFDEA